MRIGHKQYFVEYESDKYNRHYYCRETGEYGCYLHDGGNASTLRSAKQVIRNIRKMREDEHPRNFKVYDCWADVDETTNHVPCMYEEP